MVGDGPEWNKAKQLCKNLGISEKVLFFGNSNQVSDILCYSDLFLLPSETESFGLAALEAMMSKVAIVSSNTGGIPEVNKHGVTGYMSAVGDVEDMANNAISILRADAVLDKFKSQALEEALKFDVRIIVPRYEEVYNYAYEQRFKNVY